MLYYSSYFPYTFLAFFLIALYFLLEKYFIKSWQVWLWWTFCVAVLSAVAWFGIQEHPLYDFIKGYYHGGVKIIRNQNVLYDDSCYGYTNFPLMAYLFAPFGKMPKETAVAVFYIIGYISLLPLGYWLIKFAELKGWWLFLVLGLLTINGPLDYSIWLGNTTHIVMLLMVIALFFFKKGNEWVTGILLGITGLIKIPLILPSGYFFLRGKWKVVAGGLCVALAVLALSLYIIPMSLNTIWLERCILTVSGNPIPAYNNQSLSAFLARIFIPNNLDWKPVIAPAQYSQAVLIANFLLYLPAILILFFGRKFSKNVFINLLEFFIILTCSLLTSPISWTHYLALLLIPSAYYVSKDNFLQQTVWLNTLLFLSLLLLSLPVQLTYLLYQQTGYALFLSLHFFGGIFFYLFLLSIWILNFNKPIHLSNQ